MGTLKVSGLHKPHRGQTCAFDFIIHWWISLSDQHDIGKEP